MEGEKEGRTEEGGKEGRKNRRREERKECGERMEVKKEGMIEGRKKVSHLCLRLRHVTCFPNLVNVI